MEPIDSRINDLLIISSLVLIITVIEQILFFLVFHLIAPGAFVISIFLLGLSLMLMAVRGII
jgi:hypothetical protein